MKNRNRIFLGAFIAASLFITSCSNDDDTPAGVEITGDFANGMFILNEGNFGANNASVSFLDSDGTLANNIFQSVNGENLGDTAQSMLLQDDKAYIVLNVSNTIQAVNRYTFESLGTVSTGLSNPRYMVIENGKGYVSNWGDPTNPDDDYVAVINLSNYSVESTIHVAEGPDRMKEEAGKIYVAHSGGYNYGNTVSVINTSNNSVATTVSVGDVPNSLFIENGKLFVLCGGKASWTGDETLGKLVVINSTDNSVISSFDFPATQHPSQLTGADGKLYYTIDNHIYSAGTNLTSLPTSELFSTGGQGVYGIYGFAVKNGKIYVGDAVDYTSNGQVYVYNLNGSLENSFEAGLLPNGFYFND